MHDEELPSARRLRRIDDDPRASRGAPEPAEDLLGVPDSRAQPDSLQVVAREPGDPLEDAHEMRAAIGPGDRVNLVDDDDAQVGEEPRRVDALRDEHHLERLRGRHQELGAARGGTGAARDRPCRRARRSGGARPSPCRGRAAPPGC